MAQWQRMKDGDADFELKAFSVGTFENMIYIVRDPITREGYIVDAGYEPETIAAEAGDTRVKEILITHGHKDHHEHLDALKARLGVTVAIGAGDAGMLASAPERTLSDGDVLPIGAASMRVIHTPGHTPGGMCFSIGDVLLSGDTLFPGGPGNTRGNAENFATILHSIDTRLFALPDHTTVLPGHGNGTTIGAEKPSLEEWRARGW
jgi:glyoxylase-like metal-dependent hydrolase (beta-lactamase superfamily II)